MANDKLATPHQQQPQMPPEDYSMDRIPGQGHSEAWPQQSQPAIAQDRSNENSYSAPYRSQTAQTEAVQLESPQQSMSNTLYEDELTEEERIEYERGILTWAKCKHWRFWIRKEWIWYYVILVVVIVLVALMTFFHKSVSQAVHDFKHHNAVLMTDHRLAHTCGHSPAKSESGMVDSCRHFVYSFIPTAVWKR